MQKKVDDLDKQKDAAKNEKKEDDLKAQIKALDKANRVWASPKGSGEKPKCMQQKFFVAGVEMATLLLDHGFQVRKPEGAIEGIAKTMKGHAPAPRPRSSHTRSIVVRSVEARRRSSSHLRPSDRQGCVTAVRCGGVGPQGRS